MPILHMETEQVRSTGYQLQQAASTMQQESRQLAASIQNLLNAWQGPSATIFVGEIQPLLQQLAQFANAGELLNQRLQREVAEWEQAAIELGGNIWGLSPEERGQTPGGEIEEKLSWLADQSLWAEIGLGLYGLQGLSFALGSTYAEQVLVYGSRFQKELVGLGGHLTHLQGTGMSTHIFKQAGNVTAIDATLAFLQVVPQWMTNFHEYGDDPTKLAVANVVDTVAIAGVGLGAAYLGGAGGAKLGGVIGFAVGGPVGAAAGAVVGGVAGKIIASWTADQLITEPFMESTMRLDAINLGTDVVKDTGSTIKDGFDAATLAIQEVALPEFKFSW